jgi:hypothetical protein
MMAFFLYKHHLFVSLNEALDEDGSGSIEPEELEAFWSGDFQFDQ